MKNYRIKGIDFNIVGVFLILTGLVLNEYVLTALFSEDGVLETPYKVKIWFFDITLIVFGLISLFNPITDYIINISRDIFRMFNKVIEYIGFRPYLIFFLLLAVNLPLIFSTWDTGYFGDDYGSFGFLSTKLAISSFGEAINNVFRPRSDGHFTPVMLLFNIIIYRINGSPQFVHLVVVVCHILTAYIIYEIIWFLPYFLSKLNKNKTKK